MGTRERALTRGKASEVIIALLMFYGFGFSPHLLFGLLDYPNMPEPLSGFWQLSILLLFVAFIECLRQKENRSRVIQTFAPLGLFYAEVVALQLLVYVPL